MLPSAIFGVSVVVAFLGIWYGCYLHINRRRGQGVLHWLQGSIAECGQIGSVVWISPCHLRARLSLAGQAFRQPALEVRLAPRQNPLRWLLWRIRSSQETLTFQANLSSPFSESLEIGRLRWSPFNHRLVPYSAAASTHMVATLLISTQPVCQPKLSGRINGVVAAHQFDALAVSFRPSPPHFSVTFSLEEALRHPAGELPIFESLRELAQGSPTSRM